MPHDKDQTHWHEPSGNKKAGFGEFRKQPTPCDGCPGANLKNELQFFNDEELATSKMTVEQVMNQSFVDAAVGWVWTLPISQGR